MYRSPRGTKDILTFESPSWQAIENKSREIFKIFGYNEIRTPLFEETGLYIRSLGEGTDIVDKQIFSVSIHKRPEKDTQISLRPEGTAGVVRSYIEHKLDKTLGLAKLFYIGPMFRAERPQKGRLRQFSHIGAEAIGADSAYLDAEIIILATTILDNLNISGYSLKLNSLGCQKDKKMISEILQKVLSPVTKELCQDCSNRFAKNILRILDCKNEQCKNIINKAISESALYNMGYLCRDCLLDIQTVKDTLDFLQIQYELNPFLVRGLDYYTKTVFEITHPNLGSQDAIGAGGRYNNLVKDLGGPDEKAVGFALGMERIIIAGNYDTKENKPELDAYLISLGEIAKKAVFNLLNKLRKEGISCDIDYTNKSLKGQMRKANDLNAKIVCIIGENELNKQTVIIKNMKSGKQEELPIENATAVIKSMAQMEY